MYIIIPLLMIIIISFYLTIKSGRKFVETIPVTLMGITFVLYLFYCMDKLIWGIGLVMIISVTALLLSMGMCRTLGWRKCISTIIDPATIVWGVLLVVVFGVTWNCKTMLWDELRLWAAYPKILYYTDSLQMGEKALLFPMMQSYYPGMPLLAYFFEKCSVNFQESILFFTYGLFAISLLTSGLHRIHKNKYYMVPAISLIVYLVPTLCYNNLSINNYADFYKSLYIDPIVGMLSGYLMYLLCENLYTSWFDLARFALALFTITVLKDSGIAFAVLAMIGAILIYKGYKKKNILKTVALAIPFLGSWIWWRYICAINNVTNHIAFNIRDLGDLAFVKTFLLQLLKEDIVISDFNAFIAGHSFVGAYALLTLILIVTLKFLPKETRKKVEYSSIVLYISSFVFIFGLYVTCVSGFGKQTPSLARYICTVLTGLATYICLTMCSNLDDLKFTGNNQKLIVNIFAVIVIIVFPHHTTEGFKIGEQDIIYADEIADTFMKKVDEHDLKQGNVYLVCEGWDGKADYALIHHRIYFDLIGTGYNVKNFYDEALLTADDETEVQQKKAQFIAKLQKDNFDYVFLAGDGDKLSEQYPELLGNNIETNSLWKVGNKEAPVMELVE